MNDSVATPEDDQEMSLFEHLGELRSRILRSVVVIIPAVAVSWSYRWEIYGFLKAPLDQAWKALGVEGGSLHTLGPTDAFMMHMKNALVGGVLLAAPFIFYQIWSFVSPGLYKRERLMAIPFIILSTLCFVGGALFGYIYVFPDAFRILLGFNGEELVAQLVVSQYMPLFRRMLIAFGVVFEVPVIVTFLAWLGIVNWRQLIKFSRWWIVIAAVISMVLTPQDPASMIMMLIPMVVLYYVGVVGAFAVGRFAKNNTPSEAS